MPPTTCLFPMEANRSIPEQTMVVILAAGRGTRMGRSDLGKVCFEIDGVPAINRQLTTMKRRRFARFLLVVGPKAEQVLAAVAKDHAGVMYVYQEPQLGTGHAAKIAAEALQAVGHQGYVLVAMGDKYLEEAALDALVSGYVKQRADMALLTVPRTKATEGSVGRVLVDADGQALDIIERIDLARQMIADDLSAALADGHEPSGEDLLTIVARHVPDPAKQQAAVGDLLALARKSGPLDRRKLEQILQSDRFNLRVAGERYCGKQLDKLCTGVNPSLYLMRAEVFYSGVAMLRNDNAQGEYYITDMVRLLAGLRDAQGAPRYRIRAVPVSHPEWIQGFNSPDELLAIQDYVRRKRLQAQETPEMAGRAHLPPTQYAPVRQWLERIKTARPAMKRWLRSVYGPHEDLHRQKCKDLVRVLECYGRRFGFDQPVCIVRAPGRINLMGRHVDHRGGTTNFLAIDRETLAVAGLRDDNNVVAVNARPMKFRAVQFNIAELIGRFAWSDWVNFVNSDWVRNIVYLAAGDWGNYIKAAIVRLQHRYQDVRVRGINLALSGNVPIAAGLSSSSTIVVATLQAAIALNGFELSSQQFIDLCGEGEWFVGSRGGAGDHAAIYLGQRGKIAHVGYLPFRVEKVIDAPADYHVVIANSHVKAAKSETARHEFNARIAAYNLGLALLKQRCPEIAAAVEHLRDLSPAHLGCSTSDIYRWLLKVPERMTRKDFQATLSPGHRELMEAGFATHAEPVAYWPRGVLLYGAAEIFRSRLCPELLESGQVETFGRLMKISHDGDRVSRAGPGGKGDRSNLPERPATGLRPVPGSAQIGPVPFSAGSEYQTVAESPTDEHLQRLIADLASENPHRVLAAQLYMQPGYYACSTPEIDQMVDIAASVPGVAGAQIAGAGLGGCIMVLVRQEAVEAVRRALAAKYYRPRGLEPAAMPCITVEGAGLVEF